MKKKILTALALFTLVGCGGTSVVDNVSPIISGVKSTATTKVNQEIDLLSGVKATDDIDGDITFKIEIEVLPYVEVNNGLVTPSATGSYEVCYKVEDNAGNETKTYLELLVEPGVGVKEEFLSIDIEEPTLGSWNLTNDENVTVQQKINVDRYQISFNGDGNSNVSLTRNVEKDDNTTYSLFFGFTSSVAGSIIVNGKNYSINVGMNDLNCDLTSLISDNKVIIDFSSLTGDVVLEIVYLNFKEEKGSEVIINKVEGFDYSLDGNVTSDFGDGSEGNHVTTTNDATFNILKGSNGNDVWNSKMFIHTGIDLNQNTRYSIELELESTSDIDLFEICYNAGSVEKAVGALYSLNLKANTKEKFTLDVTPNETKRDLTILFQLGKMNAGVSSNSIKVSSLIVNEFGGDKVIQEESNVFTPKGFETFNDGANGASGRLYLEDGSLVYDVNSFGEIDWHNKVVTSNIALIEDKVYTIEFKAKASENIKGQFIANKMGEWKPLINDQFALTQEYETISLSSEDVLDGNYNYELLWQFGSLENKEKSNVKIYITDIVIYAQDYII